MESSFCLIKIEKNNIVEAQFYIFFRIFSYIRSLILFSPCCVHVYVYFSLSAHHYPYESCSFFILRISFHSNTFFVSLKFKNQAALKT